MMSIVFCVTVHPSPLPRRHTLPSGCSCKVCNQESKLCCRERLPSIHRLGEKKYERGGTLINLFFLLWQLVAMHRQEEGKVKYLTLHFRNKPQTLLKVRADAMQARAKPGVTVVLARTAVFVAHVKLVAALCHSRDPQVKLSEIDCVSTVCSNRTCGFYSH